MASGKNKNLAILNFLELNRKHFPNEALNI